MSRPKAASDAFRAIADPTRRAILDRLIGGELPVKELAQPFRLTQPALSQHLRVLRQVGLVTHRRAGRERLYRMHPSKLKPVALWVGQYERFWRRRLLALGEFLEKTR